ncbi:MAG: TIGR00266 family protein [Candidatus Methanoplasma sp.]|nr:TIGR00266 family protein [Candidatus Methanoplasma sp.]
MRYTITGDSLQFVNVQLDDNEEFQSVAGGMVYMTGNMAMDAKPKGGLLKGFGRSAASVPLVRFRPQGGPGIVGLGGSAPGKIADLDIGKGRWIVQKAGYLGSQTTVELRTEFQKKLNESFGREGLILQELSGSGMAFLAACGDFNTVDLKPGESYKVSTANALAWQGTVKYDVSSAGGAKAALFGGEGPFVTTLTGPGKIMIQSMALPRFAGVLAPCLPESR